MEQKKELTGRRLERAEALAEAVAVLATEPEQNSVTDALTRLVAAVKPKPRSTGPRVPLEKADPAVVKAWFDSTGLSRKQLAAAAQVSTSVISTVQNPKGDRWSTETFSAKQELITEWISEHADEIEAQRQADAKAAKEKADKEAARAAKKAARAAAPAKKAAPTKTAPADLKKGQSVTAKPRRRSRKTATPTPQVVTAA